MGDSPPSSALGYRWVQPSTSEWLPADYYLSAWAPSLIESTIAQSTELSHLTLKIPPLPDRLREIALKYLERSRRRPSLEDVELEPGQIWSTRRYKPKTPARSPIRFLPRLVVILPLPDGAPYSSRDIYIPIVPISIETDFLSADDIYISPRQSSLGYEAMIEVWNAQYIVRANLNKLVGELSRRSMYELVEAIALRFRTISIEEADRILLHTRRGQLDQAQRSFRLLERAATSYLRESNA